MMTHAYQIVIGSKELNSVYGDDKRVRRLAAKWIALFWEKHKTHISEKYPGSIAAAINEGWYNTPQCRITRSGKISSSGVIPCSRWHEIEQYDLEPIAISEAKRIAGSLKINL